MEANKKETNHNGEEVEYGELNGGISEHQRKQIFDGDEGGIEDRDSVRHPEDAQHV